MKKWEKILWIVSGEIHKVMSTVAKPNSVIVCNELLKKKGGLCI